MNIKFIFPSIIASLFITGCNSNLDSAYTSDESIKARQESTLNFVDSDLFDYYWYQGKKIYLKQNATKQYVLFDAEYYWCDKFRKITSISLIFNHLQSFCDFLI